MYFVMEHLNPFAGISLAGVIIGNEPGVCNIEERVVVYQFGQTHMGSQPY